MASKHRHVYLLTFHALLVFAQKHVSMYLHMTVVISVYVLYVQQWYEVKIMGQIE